MQTYGKTISDDNVCIPIFFIDDEKHDEESFIDSLHVEGYIQDFIKPEYADVEEPISEMNDPGRPHSNFEPISVQEHLQSQLDDKFNAKICSCINKDVKNLQLT